MSGNEAPPYLMDPVPDAADTPVQLPDSFIVIPASPDLKHIFYAQETHRFYVDGRGHLNVVERPEDDKTDIRSLTPVAVFAQWTGCIEVSGPEATLLADSLGPKATPTDGAS